MYTRGILLDRTRAGSSTFTARALGFLAHRTFEPIIAANLLGFSALESKNRLTHPRYHRDHSFRGPTEGSFKSQISGGDAY